MRASLTVQGAAALSFICRMRTADFDDWNFRYLKMQSVQQRSYTMHKTKMAQASVDNN